MAQEQQNINGLSTLWSTANGTSPGNGIKLTITNTASCVESNLICVGVGASSTSCFRVQAGEMGINKIGGHRGFKSTSSTNTFLGQTNGPLASDCDTIGTGNTLIGCCGLRSTYSTCTSLSPTVGNNNTIIGCDTVRWYGGRSECNTAAGYKIGHVWRCCPAVCDRTFGIGNVAIGQSMMGYPSDNGGSAPNYNVMIGQVMACFGVATNNYMKYHGQCNVMIGRNIGIASCGGAETITIGVFSGNCCTGTGVTAVKSDFDRQTISIGKRAGACPGGGGCSPYNIWIGQCAGRFNGAGYVATSVRNIGIGFRAKDCYSVGENIGIGLCASFSSSLRRSVVTIGSFANSAGGTGGCNTASIMIGKYSGNLLNVAASTISSVTAIGHYTACTTLANNFSNTHFGYSAGNCFTTTGNTAIGYKASQTMSGFTPYNSTAVGALAYARTQYNNAIGYTAQSSNTIKHTVWGNSSNNVCNCVHSAWVVVSDCRDKTDIESLSDTYGCEFICRLNPVKFKYDNRETYVRECNFVYGNRDGTLKTLKNQYGLLAQDVKNTIEELGIDFDGLGHDIQKDAYRIVYEHITPMLVKAIQQLISELNTISADIEILKTT